MRKTNLWRLGFLSLILVGLGGMTLPTAALMRDGDPDEEVPLEGCPVSQQQCESTINNGNDDLDYVDNLCFEGEGLWGWDCIYESGWTIRWYCSGHYESCFGGIS